MYFLLLKINALLKIAEERETPKNVKLREAGTEVHFNYYMYVYILIVMQSVLNQTRMTNH